MTVPAERGIRVRGTTLAAFIQAGKDAWLSHGGIGTRIPYLSTLLSIGLADAHRDEVRTLLLQIPAAANLRRRTVDLEPAVDSELTDAIHAEYLRLEANVAKWKILDAILTVAVAHQDELDQRLELSAETGLQQSGPLMTEPLTRPPTATTDIPPESEKDS